MSIRWSCNCTEQRVCRRQGDTRGGPLVTKAQIEIAVVGCARVDVLALVLSVFLVEKEYENSFIP